MHSTKSVGGRLQLNTHTPYLCGFEWSDTVNWCKAVWCTQNLRRDGSSFTWHQPYNNFWFLWTLSTMFTYLLPGCFKKQNNNKQTKNSRCVYSSLSPILHKVEPPTHHEKKKKKKMNRQHCALFSKTYSFSIFHQSAKDEERIFEVPRHYCIVSLEASLKTVLLFSQVSCRQVLHACSLEYNQESATSGSKALLSSTNTSAKISLSV